MAGEHPIFALADDLSGALEIGAKFAECGMPGMVVTELGATHGGVLVLDTETRHLNEIEAGNRVRQAASAALSFRPDLIYKKTDSTLRGNIGAELRALREVFGVSRLVYAPAYPDMGRTVKNGELFVWGTRVHETEFASDRWNPIHDCRIETVLGGTNALVLDGESNADVDAAARTILAEPMPRVCAGPAALAGALARRLRSDRKSAVDFPKVSRALVVNGSLHPVSTRQIMWAEEQGFFNSEWIRLDEQDGAGIVRAMQTGERVRQIVNAHGIEALIVFGGDTAFGIHSALGSLAFEPLGEVAPGVPASKSGGLLWITKAGGFGAPDILETVRKRLT